MKDEEVIDHVNEMAACIEIVIQTYIERYEIGAGDDAALVLTVLVKEIAWCAAVSNCSLDKVIESLKVLYTNMQAIVERLKIEEE